MFNALLVVTPRQSLSNLAPFLWVGQEVLGENFLFLGGEVINRGHKCEHTQCQFSIHKLIGVLENPSFGLKLVQHVGDHGFLLRISFCLCLTFSLLRLFLSRQLF